MAKRTRTPKDDFQIHLDNAMKTARAFFYNNHRMLDVQKTDAGEVINIFGGFWQWHIDREHKRVYEISKQRPFEPDKVKWNEDFTLFVRQRTAIRDKLYIWSREAIEMALESLDAATHGIVYVRQRDMLKVPFIISAQEMMARQKRVAKAAMTVLNTCWGAGFKLSKVFGTIGKVLWSHLDPEICRLALMLGGQKTNVIDYNLVWANLDEVRKVAKHSSGILPIWREIATQRAMQTGQFHQPDIVADVRNHLNSCFGAGNSLTKRGWRWLIKQKPLWIQQLLKHYSALALVKSATPAGYAYGDGVIQSFDLRINYLPAVLDFLGTVDTQPRFTVYYHTIQGLYRQQRSKELIAMVRAAFVASLKKPAKSFYRTEVSLAMDWITREPGLHFDANQLKADWAWFMRKQREWHDELAQRRTMETINTRWESLVPEYQHDEYKVVPLTTAHDLHIEGKVMHHCFGAGAMVRARRGWVPIESVLEGESVLSGDGTFRRVIRTVCRPHSGSVKRITNWLSGSDVIVTPDHEFSVLIPQHAVSRECRLHTCGRTALAPKLTHSVGWRAITHSVGWRAIGETASRPYVSVVTLKIGDDVEEVSIPADLVGASKRGDNTFRVDAEFLYMAGVYLAEGNASRGLIQFSFSKRERHLAGRIENYFRSRGYGTRYRKDEPGYGGLVLYVQSSKLSRWFGLLFGRGCDNKSVPAVLLNLPSHKLEHLIAGLLDGDGCESRNVLHQTSRTLAIQVSEICLRLQRLPSVSVQHNAGKKTSYVLSNPYGEMPGRRTRRKNVWRHGPDILYRLREIADEAYEGNVYDLEIDGVHSYVVNNMLVHNCVGTYAGNCEQGSSRIFSIRKDGVSIATFELKRKAPPNQPYVKLPAGTNQYEEAPDAQMEFENFAVPWGVAQCRGACNASVPDLEPIAQSTAAMYEKACMELDPKDRFFRVMRPNFTRIETPTVEPEPQPTHQLMPVPAVLPEHPQVAANPPQLHEDNADLAAAIREGRELTVVEVDDFEVNPNPAVPAPNYL